MPLYFEKYASKGDRILDELTEELGDAAHKELSAKLLRAVLHTLRNIIPLEESMQFIAQLPLIIKGIYVDGWTPLKKQKKIKTTEEFVDEALKLSMLHPDDSIFYLKSKEEVVRSVIRVLRKHVSEGEISDVKACMPNGLVELWDEVLWID